SKITANKVREIIGILLPDWRIQIVARIKVFSYLWRHGPLFIKGASRGCANHEKSRRDNNQNHRNGLRDAFKDIAKHRSLLGLRRKINVLIRPIIHYVV